MKDHAQYIQTMQEEYSETMFAVQKWMLRDSRVKWPYIELLNNIIPYNKWIIIFLRVLDPYEDGTDKLSRNVSKLPASIV